MERRRWCLVAWTIAAGIVTGALSGCNSQCVTNSRPAHLIANQNKTLSFTVQSLANTVRCEWLISSNIISTRLRLTAATFNLRSHNGSCVDNFTVYDGSSSSSPILLSTCSRPDFPIYSSGSDVFVSFTTGFSYSAERSNFTVNYEVFRPSGQSLYITFHSDGSRTGKGFDLTYTAAVRSVTYLDTSTTCSLYPQSQTANSYFVYLQYPTTSSNYPNNADCGWLFTTANYDYVVHVAFTFVDTEYDSDCDNDYIQVFDGSSSYSASLGKLCGTRSRDYYSTGQSVYIKFHSDGSTTGSGFNLTYKAVARWDVPGRMDMTPRPPYEGYWDLPRADGYDTFRPPHEDYRQDHYRPLPDDSSDLSDFLLKQNWPSYDNPQRDVDEPNSGHKTDAATIGAFIGLGICILIGLVALFVVTIKLWRVIC